LLAASADLRVSTIILAGGNLLERTFKKIFKDNPVQSSWMIAAGGPLDASTSAQAASEQNCP
jgi:hypothetical protein